MAGGRWLAVDGRWSMGWQLAGGVNLVIPPGTAVRDAHASPDLLPASYYYHYSPIVDLTGPYTLARNTNEIPLCGIVGDYDV